MCAIAITSYCLAAVLTFKFHNSLMALVGRKNALLFGIFLVTTSTVGMGILQIIDNWKVFYGVTFAVRMTHGYANALCLSVLYSITS